MDFPERVELFRRFSPKTRFPESSTLNAVDFPELLVTVRGLGSASSKLLLIVGVPASGKSRFLRRVGDETGWPIVNIGKEVSQRLLALTKRQRRIKAEEVVADVLDSAGSQQLCIDNTEVLFDPSLAVNPVALFTNLSRNRLLVASWNGRLENGSLVYAEPGHPEYFKGPAHGFPVVTLIDEKMRLSLQP